MKLRTSLFNPTVFKKDLTRFAPAWALYTVGLFMMLTIVMSDGSEYYRASTLADTLSFMAFINICYGFLNGQLLFGDLFNARNCNALHAMPLRRECWFTTHTVSGLLFALAPNALFALVALPMLGTGWTVAVWWFLATAMQYLFFFGLAVLSALCVGNRFAMVLVFGIINFFAVIVYWFYYSIYEPLLYGVSITEEPFLLWCPIVQMMEHYNMIEVLRLEVPVATYTEYFVDGVTLGEGWGYLGICAGLGAAFLGTALLLYRRRKLESAGDFMAVRPLEPVFLVLYTMSMAAFFQAFAELFGISEFLFLALGLAVGFFTGRMLLMRTTKVFQAKGFLWFGILAAAFALSMLLTWLDPLGVTTRIPTTGSIDSVRLTTQYYPQYSNAPDLTDTADIETVRKIHLLVLEDDIHGEDSVDYYNTLSIQYQLKNGVTVIRRYEVSPNSPAGEMAGRLYSRADYVLGSNDLAQILSRIDNVYYDENKANGTGVSGHIYMNHTNRAYIEGLVEAIMADCAEGTMAQNHAYHDDEEQVAWIEFATTSEENGGGWYDYHNISIYPSNRHTVAYLEENPFPVESIE